MSRVTSSSSHDDSSSFTRISLWFRERLSHLQSSSTSSSFTTTIIQWDDIVAGTIVGILIVPQSMSYAKIAGLPVAYGLYSSLVPLGTYAGYGLLLVPSEQHSLLSIGPVALISFMLASGLSQIMTVRGISPQDDTSHYAIIYEQLAVQSSLLVGILSIGMGMLRYRTYTVGHVVTQCFSHTVISGFTSGAAAIIALSQSKYLGGYTQVPPADTVPTILRALWRNRNQIGPTKVVTWIMGGLSLLILLLARHWSSSSSSSRTVMGYRQKQCCTMAPLLVTVTAVLSTIWLQQQARWLPPLYQVQVVGEIPRGLPHSTVSTLWNITGRDVVQLFPVALSMTIIGLMESIAIAKQLASKQQQQQQQQRVVSESNHPPNHRIHQVDTSQELLALGLSNVMGSLFHSYPVAGSFSRSAMNYSAGGRTRWSGLVTAGIVAMALLILTPFFEQLPYNTLAAIVISGVVGLFDYKEAILLWKVDRIDCMVWWISCGGTMCFGCEYGLALALLTSFVAALYKLTFLPIVTLGHVSGTDHYRNVQQFPDALPIKDIVMIRIGGPLYFANIAYIEQTVQALIHVSTMGQNSSRVANSDADMSDTSRSLTTQCYVVIDMSCVVYIDATAMRRWKHMINAATGMVQFCFSDVSNHIAQQFEMSGGLLVSRYCHIFPSIHDAVQYCMTQQRVATAHA